MNDSSCLLKLQYDLENYLRSLTAKYNTISKKISSSTNLDVKDKQKVSDIGQRRASVSDTKPYKKSKLSSEKTQKSSLSARAKTKRTQPAKSQESEFPEKSVEVPKVQKNDSLNRFWAFFDCYCADITTEDVNVLEKWIESHERDSEYQNIPELGIHYSTKWMEEKIVEEVKEGSKSMENPKGIDNLGEESYSHIELLRKKAEEKINALSDSEQPSLFNKIMFSLVQENIVTSNDMMSESVLDDDSQEGKVDKAATDVEEKVLQKLSRLSENNLENCLKHQLAELGVLEMNLTAATDDELLQELKRLQSLLIPISELNIRKKKALMSRAKAEIAKQEAQKRIQEADLKVMDSYRIMMAARQKGKKLVKKELSQIRSILEEREKLIKNTKS